MLHGKNPSKPNAKYLGTYPHIKMVFMAGKSYKASIFASLAVLAVIILAVLIVGIVILNPSKSSANSQLPQFQNTSAPVPSAFSTVLTLPSQQTTANLAALTQTHITAAQQFNVSYNGSIYVRPSGLVGAIAQINSPLYVSESKYGSDTKLYMNITSLPIVGVGKLIYLNLTNGTYSCTNLNVSAKTSGFSLSSLSANRNITCVHSTTLAGVNVDNLTRFDLSELGHAGAQLNYQKVYQSTYMGMSCTYMFGNMIQTASNGTTTGTGEFDMCMSDTYYVPLSLSMYFNTQSLSLMFNMNETSISNQSNQSYIESLPGPVVG